MELRAQHKVAPCSKHPTTLQGLLWTGAATAAAPSPPTLPLLNQSRIPAAPHMARGEEEETLNSAVACETTETDWEWWAF